jgi:hypothetical protein
MPRLPAALFAILGLLFGLAVSPAPALAQAPPGYICVVPGGWCWADRPGIPGTPCFCPAGGGFVQGVLQ